MKGEKGKRTLKVFNSAKSKALNVRLEFKLLNPQDS